MIQFGSVLSTDLLPNAMGGSFRMVPAGVEELRALIQNHPSDQLSRLIAQGQIGGGFTNNQTGDIALMHYFGDSKLAEIQLAASSNSAIFVDDWVEREKDDEGDIYA
jgi:hypothetical protein